MKKYFQLLCFLLMARVVTGQQINLIRAPQPNSFSYGGVGAEDTKGYMWFGSQKGLHRFDGYRYITYVNDPLDSNSLANNIIECIYAANDGTIWIGTSTSGLDRLNPASGKFTHFRYNENNDESISSDRITAIGEDKKGMIWVGTADGLNLIDPNTKNVVRFKHDSTNKNSLSNNHVRAVYVDRKGTVWIGTGSAFSGNGGNFGGLNTFIPETKSFQHYLHDPANKKSLADNRVRAIFEDSHGIFWVGTAGDGLHTMNRDKGEFVRHSYDPDHPDKLSRGPLKKVISWATDHITFINEDAAGYIWIGTLGNGVNRYDYKSGTMINIPDDPGNGAEGQRKASWWSHTSKDGVLWIGYWSGVYHFDPLRTQVPFFQTGYTVQCILRDSSDLWIGTDKKLIVKNLVTQKERIYTHNTSDHNSIDNNNVRSLYKDMHGTIWIGTDNGLNKFDRQTGHFTTYKVATHSDAGLNDNTVYSILRDRSGNIWFTTLGEGLIRIESGSGTLSRYKNLAGDTSTISHGSIKCAYEDRDGNIWIGFYLNGVNKINPTTKKVEHYLYGTDVNNIFQDAFGIVWIATQSGLYRSDTAMNVFTLYHDMYNEIQKNIGVGAILEDNYKTLWMSSSVGILKLSPRRDRLMVWAKNKDITRYADKADDGVLYFADRNGYFAFDPAKLKINHKAPTIVINEFKLADSVVPLSNDSEIDLTYDQNNFSFQFAGLHFTDPSSNRHLFMLEGVDNTWRNGGEEKTAYYNNVQPGKYTFHIKAANSDGIWSEKKMKIIIYPPWWQTWWAHTLYAVIAASLIWAFIAFRLKNLRSQLAQKEKEKQFEELRRQKSEIEMQALRAQMNPHFIFNSLNSINRFILHNNKNDASEYLSKFSRLVRLILNNSQASSIPLQNELEALELYLELESLRFDNHFNFKINVDPEVDAGVVKVPPLIIQPFAENAIWHGLMHKKEQGNLEIDITMEENILVYKVKDDGIGRKKATELKNESRTSHKSFGMKITASRIDLLQQQNGNGSSIVVNDLVLPDNSPAGTEVLIKLPLNYDQSYSGR